MSKIVLRIICAILCLLLCLPILTSCGKDNVYELGPYSISEEEYAYLLCSYKRTILEDLGIDESYLSYPISAKDSTTYGEYIERMYREQFEQSVYTLLFSLALFDEYNLELSKEKKDSIKAAANSVIFYYGNGSVSKFNSLAKEYGFSDDSLRSIYEKQAMESMVVSHIFGEKYSNLTDINKDDYYEESYIRFQVIVVNTLYHQDSDGDYSNLSPEETATMKSLEDEMIELLVRENLNYNYKILPVLLGKTDMSTVTYEELWANPKINDDSLYPNGYYMVKPNTLQMSTPTTLSQAMLTQVGDVSSIAAKRYFDGSGTITTEKGDETINAGDYFEYGTAFIKRLPLDDGAWKSEANKDFFGDSFISGAAQLNLFKTLQSFEKTSPYTMVVESSLKEDYSLATIPANYLDYDYLHGTEEQAD